ncbi:hypothetical protein SFUMM280S_01856 [Streptomyces fumanus]
MVVAAPAHMMPRSARIHSMRVAEASATRCSGAMPRSIRPAAMAWTRSAAWAQVSDFQSSGPWPAADGTG